MKMIMILMGAALVGMTVSLLLSMAGVIPPVLKSKKAKASSQVVTLQAVPSSTDEATQKSRDAEDAAILKKRLEEDAKEAAEQAEEDADASMWGTACAEDSDCSGSRMCYDVENGRAVTCLTFPSDVTPNHCSQDQGRCHTAQEMIQCKEVTGAQGKKVEKCTAYRRPN